MPPIWLTNRGLNATICCLSQLCKYSRLTNWVALFTTSTRKEEARPWGNMYHHLFFLPSSDPTSFLIQPYCISSLIQPYFLPHAALIPPLRSPFSSLMQSYFLPHAALIPPLKGPKHDIFEIEFLTQIRPVRIGDLGTGEKNWNIVRLSYDSKVFAAYILLSVWSACA